MRKFLNLTLFAEGAAAGGMSVNAGNATSMSGTAGDATGIGAGSDADSVDAAQVGTRSFAELIKDPAYKADADAYIEGIIKGRLAKPTKTINDQREILQMVASKYDLDGSDLKALKERVSADDAYLEDKAMAEGLTVEQYRRIADAERKAASYEAQVQQAEQERAVQEQVAAWQEQAEQVKQIFPDFDLQSEMQNPTFQRLLSSGIDMRSAFVACHDAEVLQGAMQYTAAEVRKATANELRSKGSRPRENASSSQASASARTDVSRLTRADRAAMAERAMRGEIVDLTNYIK